VPRDSETITRSVQRKIFGLDSKSSFPLLSGDTFKYMCDSILEGPAEITMDALELLQDLNGRLFVQAEPMSSISAALVKACKSGLKFPKANLVIHNGDLIPNLEEVIYLRNSFRSVYSVNWLGDPSIATALPIGLENRDKRRNGVPKDYTQEIARGLPSRDERDISILVAFSLHTNFEERSLALEYAKKIPGAHIIDQPITPKQFRKLILRSKYVLSPPGNGPDCHRTWEALYLGSTPVVHRKSWAFSGHAIPALVVDSWAEIGEKIKTETPLSKNNSWKDVSYWIPS
jgi:hypothetical protein